VIIFFIFRFIYVSILFTGFSHFSYFFLIIKFRIYLIFNYFLDTTHSICNIIIFFTSKITFSTFLSFFFFSLLHYSGCLLGAVFLLFLFFYLLLLLLLGEEGENIKIKIITQNRIYRKKRD